MDDLHVVRFNAKERDRRGTFRWTRGQSYLSLLGVDETRRELVIWMNNGEPASARPDRPPSRRSSARRRWARSPSAWPTRPTYSTFPSRSPRRRRRNVGAATIRLISSTFNPRALTGADDDRDLGVMVDRVELRRVAAAR